MKFFLQIFENFPASGALRPRTPSQDDPLKCPPPEPKSSRRRCILSNILVNSAKILKSRFEAGSGGIGEETEVIEWKTRWKPAKSDSSNANFESLKGFPLRYNFCDYLSKRIENNNGTIHKFVNGPPPNTEPNHL